MKFLLIFISIFLFSGMSNPAYTDAQGIEPPKLQIVLQPSFPKPGESVIAKINDYGTGTYGSSIDWFFDGEQIAAARNQRQATFTAGENGSVQKIQVVISKPSGIKETIERLIRPVYLDIIIEPQTRVPDFYLGRSLPSIGSTVNATAIITRGDTLDSDNLVYTWKINNKVIEGGALRGGNRVSFTTPRGTDSTLSLEVTNLNRDIIGKRGIIIPSIKPEIHFYDNDPLFGLSQHPIKSKYNLIGQILTIKAEPYYLDINTYNDPSYYQWKIDGVKNPKQNNPYELTIQKVESGTYTNLEFEVRNLNQVLQGAEGNMQIKL